MVAAFAEENHLATIVGAKTPGRLLSGSAFKVGQGYVLRLPVAGYLTWQGRMPENNGIIPIVPADLSRDASRNGRDSQLEKASRRRKPCSPPVPGPSWRPAAIAFDSATVSDIGRRSYA
jgi:C-terminal processing protease CtpA/Prc